MRTLAIGDIHGHLAALVNLLRFVELQPEDRIIFLGDYVDKGPDVKGVIELLRELAQNRNAVFLLGNHDEMMIDAYRDPLKVAVWECLGGNAPLASYGEGPLAEVMEKVPASHRSFLEETCLNYLETPEYIFVHGGIRPEMNPAEEEKERLLWTTLALAAPHYSGRTVVCGHSSQRSGRIADLGHTICIDTAITHAGWLSCLALGSFEYWQVKTDGTRRSGFLRPDKAGGLRG